MKFKNTENKCYTTTCGQQIYKSRATAVVGMVLMRYKGELYVILGKRGESCPDEVGKWCMPCGYLDWDETIQDAVIRETWEESGFNINKAMNTYEILSDNMNHPWRINSESEPGASKQNISHHYAICLDAGESSLPELNTDNNAVDDEVSEVKWAKVSDIDLYDTAFGHSKIIKVYTNNLFLDNE